MGNVQSGCGLRTGGPRWPVRAAPDEAHGCPGARGTAHGTFAGTGIWKVSWGQPLTKSPGRPLLPSLLAGRFSPNSLPSSSSPLLRANRPAVATVPVLAIGCLRLSLLVTAVLAHHDLLGEDST